MLFLYTAYATFASLPWSIFDSWSVHLLLDFDGEPIPSKLHKQF